MLRAHVPDHGGGEDRLHEPRAISATATNTRRTSPGWPVTSAPEPNTATRMAQAITAAPFEAG